MTVLSGSLLTVAAGLVIGCCPWPFKVLRVFRFEHWWFAAMFTGLVIIPWTGTLACCPHALAAYAGLPTSVLIKSNLFALAWGVANVIYGICLVRLGVALAGAIITGVGVAVGVTLPLVMKGSGLFSSAPDLLSKAGLTVLAGVTIMLMGVALVAVAGTGRDRAQSGTKKASGSFMADLVLCFVAGVMACGSSLAFVYGQGPIVAAMKARGAGEIAANLAVWAGGFACGALVNLAYPAYLMTRKRSWNVLAQSWREVCLASLTGVQLMLGFVCMGRGMVLLGALGASVGFGIQQATQLMGTQGLGFISGEWGGVPSRTKSLMLIAITILIVAAVIMAYGNTL